MRTVQSEITDDEKLKLLELENMKQNLEQQLQEMTRIIERQQKMITLAKRDPLTGLRNRQGVPELVNASLRAHCEGLFFIMDLDNFKCINDTYGHMEGDRMLIKFAKALKEVMDPKDIIARLGGDEFAVFSPKQYNTDEVKSRARRFIRQIERSLTVPGRAVQVTVSMGIANAPHDGTTYEALYGNADRALYGVKNEGKNGYRFFSDLNSMGCGDIVYCRPHSSIDEITGKLKEKEVQGSFEVEFSHFEKIYRFMERTLIRDYREIQCVLFTLENYTNADATVIQKQLKYLQHAIEYSLRKGDVTTTYRPTQVLALLMDVSTKNACTAAERVLCKYRREAGRDMIDIRYDIRQLAAGAEADAGVAEQ